MTHRTFTLVGVLAALIPLSSWACSTPVGISQAEYNRRDLRFQKKIARDLAQDADAIFTGKVVRDDKVGTADIQVMELLKGQVSGVQTARYDPDDRYIGCTRSYYFQQVWIGLGHEYLFYIKAGVVRRAGSLEDEKDKWDLSLADEKKIIRKVVPNNSLQRR